VLKIVKSFVYKVRKVVYSSIILTQEQCKQSGYIMLT